MRKTQPGIDRIETVQARSIVTSHKTRLSGHMITCFQCSKANGDMYAHCDKWWELAKLLHEAKRVLASMEQPCTEGELTLFEIDEMR